MMSLKLKYDSLLIYTKFITCMINLLLSNLINEDFFFFKKTRTTKLYKHFKIIFKRTDVNWNTNFPYHSNFYKKAVKIIVYLKS